MSDGGNLETRVNSSVRNTTGLLPASTIFKAFRDELLKDNIMKKLFGDQAERVFDNQRPNLNETIVPALLLSWGNETFMSRDTKINGTIDAAICLPVMLQGDYNALRRVANIFQRFITGPMDLFSKVDGKYPVAGLTRFGFNATYDYRGLAAFDGFTCPVIQIQLPYEIDLQLMRLQDPTFDPSAHLDDAELGWIEEYGLGIFNAETNETLIPEGVLLETGQTN